MKIGIGIDTGGTYTDAIAYDFDSGSVLGSAKSLTTKSDLSQGILGALDGLPHALLSQCEIVSLSTTLATNACVEDKGGNAKLIFFGADPAVIDELGWKYGLPAADEMYIQKSYTKFSGDIDREPDWALFRDRIAGDFEHCDGAGIIEVNAMKNGAVVEKRAKEIFEELHDIPVVCGHELFSELNCLQRGSSTLLNAELFPVIKEFLAAIKRSLAERGVNAEIVIVRSDGSLMSEEFAALRPVETLLCGPAASVIGGASLSKSPNNIIVDMGGTTTDIALMRDGVPISAVDGVSIGRWRTFVNGLYIRTFGLGGDSAVHYCDNGSLRLEEYRVVPLCVAATQYPRITENLRVLAENAAKHSLYLHEHYMLAKDISDSTKYTTEEKAFCEAIRPHPLMLREAAEAVGQSIYVLDVQRLIHDGVVQICGLTPTDIMHIRGDFERYDARASYFAARFVAINLGLDVDGLCAAVYNEVRKKLYVNITKAMLENEMSHYAKHGFSDDMNLLIEESYEQAKSGGGKILTMGFTTEFSLIGIGAPMRIFLPEVAAMLRAEAVIPEHCEVANALGAIAGNVSSICTLEIKPSYDIEGISGYTVFGSFGTSSFESVEDATEFAIKQAKRDAKVEAKSRGARGGISVTCDIEDNNAPARNCTIYLGTTVTAHAIGSMGF